MRRRTVGGSNEWVVPVVTLTGVGLLAYFLFKKFGGPGSIFESGTNQTNNQGVDQTTQQAGASGSTVSQISPDNQINAIATAIYNAGASNDGGQIARQLSSLVNQGDFNRLYQMFGTKQASTSMLSTCNLLGFNCQSMDLAAWVVNICSDDELEEINANLSANGINFRF